MDAINRRPAAAADDDEEAGSSITLADASHIALIGLLIIAIFATLSVARSVIVPLTLSWAIGTALIPLVERLRRWGVPGVFSAIGAAAVFLLTIISLLALLMVPISYWIGRASELGALVKQKLSLLSRPLSFFSEIASAVRDATGAQAAGGVASTSDPASMLAENVLGWLSPMLTQGLLFVGGLVFFLIYREQMKRSFVLLDQDRERRLTMLKILTEIESNMSRYFSTVTIVNIGLGCAVALLSWAVGLPNPVLWGALTTVLNFIPYIGPALTAVALGAAGLFVFPSISEALIAPAGFVVISIVESEIVTPAILGRSMSINPFLVFIAIGFWSWLWGPIGAFLAVPILMVATVVWSHIVARDAIELPG